MPAVTLTGVAAGRVTEEQPRLRIDARCAVRHTQIEGTQSRVEGQILTLNVQCQADKCPGIVREDPSSTIVVIVIDEQGPRTQIHAEGYVHHGR